MNEKCGEQVRVEKDSLGEMAVPINAYYGIHALRARPLQN